MDQAQNLVKTAVNATISEISKGKTPTDALKKVASDMKLNPNFIQRAGEAVNVALHMSHFKTAAAKERAADFPIVDIPEVAKSALATPNKTLAEKKAAWFPTVNDNPNFNRRLFDNTFTKTAAEKFSAQEEAPAYSLQFVAKQLQDKVARLEKQYDEVATEKVANSIFLESSMNGLISYFKKEAAARESFHEFETAAYAMHGTKVKPYIDLIHTHSKTAEERGVHLPYKFAGDHSHMPSVSAFFSFMNAVNSYGALQDKVAYVKAELELTKAGIKAAYAQAVTPEEAADAIKQADELQELFSKQAGMVTKSIADKLIEDYKNAAKTKATPVFSNTSMDNRNRTLLLQELIMTDPILAHQDPKRIVDSYQQILRLAPHLAKEKEVVRSLLRQMTATQSLAPVEANQLIETNTNLLRQYELLKKTTGGGDKK